ncbi:addiction module protein [Reichenbachiella sp.]|uniref:addiction module protein n=1 Tax=Reichenbachiella sp. TaxID=2184521 RepID=UPI003B58EE76
MSGAELRDEIHKYVDQADDRVLQMIYGLFQADLTEDHFEFSDEHKRILDERLENHESNPVSGSSWEETKSRIVDQL